jgi:predicted nucleotidyltransferase
MMTVQRLREALPGIVADLTGVSLVYLFGSRKEGQIGPLSDYDLGVLVERGDRESEIQAQLAHKLARGLQTDRLDVLLLNRAPIELAHAVVAQGEVLYQRDAATRVEYESDVLSRYGDYLPVLRAQRQEILEGDKHAKRVQRYRAALRRTERTLGQIRAAQRQDAG